VVAAAPRHRLAGGHALAPAALAGESWLVGPSGDGPDTAVGAFLACHRLPPRQVLAFPSHAAAAAAAAAGRGVMLAIAHTILAELNRRALVALDVRGTPVEGFFWATLLPRDRRPPAAAAFRRFVTTPEATQAMLARPGGVPAGRFRPPVYVTLWS
jgi:DNA-binding transcriptional LysR family regulator